jgi:hypothetical protein
VLAASTATSAAAELRRGTGRGTPVAADCGDCGGACGGGGGGACGGGGGGACGGGGGGACGGGGDRCSSSDDGTAAGELARRTGDAECIPAGDADADADAEAPGARPEKLASASAPASALLTELIEPARERGCAGRGARGRVLRRGV